MDVICVLHIGLSDQFGGIESFLLNLHNAIDREKFRFDYVAYGSDTPREDEFRALGAEVYHLTNRKNPFAYAYELRAIMSRGYDIIHVHKNSAADIVPFICADKMKGTLLCAHAHNTRSGAGAAASMLNRVGRIPLTKMTDYKFACSDIAGEWLYGDKCKIDAVIPNGINLTAYTFCPEVRRKIRSRLGVGDELVIGCVGRFRREKNQAFLIGVLKELYRRGITASALFLGDGSELETTKERFASEGIADAAIFLGSVKDVSSYMQAMDVLAMPSLFEGLPLAAIEAQAASLPTLLSNCITEEVCLTQLTKRLPIGEGTESLWADEIAGLKDHQRIGVNLSGLGAFDSSEAARLIGKVYEDAIR